MNVAELVADVMNDANRRAQKIIARSKVLDQLAEIGVKPHYRDGVMRWGYSIDVEKDQLTAIRGVVGRLTMTSKDVAPDFDTTNELQVELRPVDTNFPVSFQYRTKYRAGGKCEVVTSVSQASISKSLVCKI